MLGYDVENSSGKPSLEKTAGIENCRVQMVLKNILNSKHNKESGENRTQLRKLFYN